MMTQRETEELLNELHVLWDRLWDRLEMLDEKLRGRMVPLPIIDILQYNNHVIRGALATLCLVLDRPESRVEAVPNEEKPGQQLGTMRQFISSTQEWLNTAYEKMNV